MCLILSSSHTQLLLFQIVLYPGIIISLCNILTQSMTVSNVSEHVRSVIVKNDRICLKLKLIHRSGK